MKYAPEQLQLMAVMFLSVHAAKDARAERLIDAMHERTGLTRDEVLLGIHRLAMDVTTEWD